jgi:hypothetical protein
MISDGAFIGIFWYIDDAGVIIYEKFPINSETLKSNLFITSPVSHPIVWEKHKKIFNGVPYTFYPRGRVNYQVPKDMFELDMDGCLHNNVKFFDELFRIYSLTKDKTIIIPPARTNVSNKNYENEGHYRCHNCAKEDFDGYI